MSERFTSSCLVTIGDGCARRVNVTMGDVISSHGPEIVSLLRLLHQRDSSDRWTDSLAPWVLSAAANQLTPHDRSVAVVGWLSPHLVVDNQSKLFDPNAHVGLFARPSGQQGVPAFAAFANGRVAALACRVDGDPDIVMLQQAFLTGDDVGAILTRLGSIGTVSSIGTVGSIGAVGAACWLDNAGHPENTSDYDGPLDSALALPTIDHLCAYVIAQRPELRSCPALGQEPGIGNGAMRNLALTSADVLEGSPSTRALLAAGGQPGFPSPPPNPYGHVELWRSWLNAPVTASPFPVSRLLCDVRRRRVDLQEHFPDLGQVRYRIAFLEWAASHASNPSETGLPAWAIASDRALPKITPIEPVMARTAGVTVVGFLDSALGLGEAARIMVRNLVFAGETVSTLTWHHIVSPPVVWRDRHPTANHDIQVLCVNGSELARWNRSAPVGVSTGAFRIGLWFWETDQLSAEMIAGAALLDEIWVTSEYTATVVRASIAANIAVLVIPLGMQNCVLALPSSTRQLSREKLRKHITGISSEAWWCGTSFDIASQIERKNPLAMIDAWKLAFPDENMHRTFVIKAMNGEQQPENLQHILNASENRNDIVVIDATWTPEEQHHFVRSLDVYMSLHRSEGYGLMLLEALAVGTPTIATAATGNLAFMTDANSWLVSATDLILDADAGPYRKGAKVSEPSIELASQYLTQLFAKLNPMLTHDKIEKGRSDVAGLVDGTTPANWIRLRLAHIRRNRSGRM